MTREYHLVLVLADDDDGDDDARGAAVRTAAAWGLVGMQEKMRHPLYRPDFLDPTYDV
jgi:hypothetical protein